MVVTSQKEVIWEQALPRGTSAQSAEKKKIALTQDLRWLKEKNVNIYTDSQYAFAMAHVHGQISKQRSLLTLEGKTIKNKYEIIQLLEAIWLPWTGHYSLARKPKRQNPKHKVTNKHVDQVAKEAALREPKTQPALELSAVPEPPLCLYEDVSEYNTEKIKLYSDLGTQENNTDGRFAWQKNLHAEDTGPKLANYTASSHALVT